MENDLKKNKIERFVKDEVMCNAVYEFIRDTFLSNKGSNDVNYLASQYLAFLRLEEAWKDLSRLKDKKEESNPQLKQIGL